MKVIEKLKDGCTCFLDSLSLIGAFCLPHMFNLKTRLQEFTVDPTGIIQVLWNYVLQRGNTQLGLFFFVIALIAIRKKNLCVALNTDRNIYHDWPLAYYWYCSMVLGIKKCWLVGVPIPKQIKISLRGYFQKENLLFGDISIEKKDVNAIIRNCDGNDTLLVLQDTYKIEEGQYPPDIPKERVRIINIDNCSIQGNRHYNESFVLEVLKQVKDLPERTTLYLVATTNPKHNIELAERVFSVGERNNVSSFYVYQQERSTEESTEENNHVNRPFLKCEKIY